MAISHQLIKYRRWFGWGFVASLPVFVVALWLAYEASADPTLEPSWLTVLLSVSLIITSLTLVGFLVIAVSTWRKKLDHTEIELEKSARIDLEKLRAEINDKNAAAQIKRNKTTKRKRPV